MINKRVPAFNKLSNALFLPLLFIPCIAHAAVYKCVVSDSVTYSATPCSSATGTVVHNTVSIVPATDTANSATTDANYISQSDSPDPRRKEL